MNSDSEKAQSGTYTLLNMGDTRYGDCVVCRFGKVTVLIDGGHRGDLEGQEGYPSLPDQLSSILGGKTFHVALLVVTHCHDDHIGCLPELVDAGLLTADWALVTDEKWGFGRVSEHDGADSDAVLPGLDDSDPDVRRVVAALCEEDYSDAKADEIAGVLADAETVESRYLGMLAKLKASGTKIIRHGRDRVPPAFTDAFAGTGLTIIGPTREHLEICAKVLARFARNAASAAKSAKASDANVDLPALYRQLASGGGIGSAVDMAGTSGPPRNNMSIVLAFGGEGNRALFGGDMQFAQPEVADLDDEMAKLRKAVQDAGPYDIVKTLHHTSYNGQDDEVLAEWGSPKLLAHSGGRHDPNHPDKGTLSLLRGKRTEFDFARTDRNGIVQINAAAGFTIEGGKLDDFSINRTDDAVAAGATVTVGLQTRAAAPTLASGEMQFVVARLPYGPTRITIDGVTIEVQPLGQVAPDQASGGRGSKKKETEPHERVTGQLAGGRKLPSLLFVANAAGLARNIGEQACATALSAIRDAGQTLLLLTPDERPTDQVSNTLKENGKFQGIVLLGGYDIIPAMRLDVLSPELRQKLGDDARNDLDDFIVWSDAAYGDLDGDGLANLPVSRIPDGHDADLVFAALFATTSDAQGKFGIRNARRAFADQIWALIPGDGDMAKSSPFGVTSVDPADFRRPFLYFMLHGGAEDGTEYLGETALQEDAMVEALRANQLASAKPYAVFAGCCWGALTVDRKAMDNGDPSARRPDASIALSFLKAGAVAFIGCTGSHYSPDSAGGYAGGPVHRSFWTYLCTKKLRPSEALFQAKVDYVRDMPHGRTDLYEMAIERKIVREFTCLGLGW